MATLQSGKCFTVPTFFVMCCRSEWQERMYIYKWHEVDQTKHEIFCVHIVCNEIQVKVNLEITTFFFYLRFPYCPNFFWFGVVCIYIYTGLQTATKTIAFVTKNINLRVKLLLRSPLATIYIYMLWQKKLHVRTFFLIVLRSHLLLCSRIKLKIKRQYASKF